MSGEADAGGEKHEPVRINQKTRWRRWFSAALTAAGRLPGKMVPRWTFAAVTLAPVLFAVAWLVPGTGLLLAGRLVPLPMIIIFVPLAVAACYFAMRLLPVAWPEPGTSGKSRRVPSVALLAMMAVAAGFGVWQAYYHSEQLFTADGPGVYLQYGYWIAEHGTARIPASAAAFGGAGGLDFATRGFTVSGGFLRPAYLPGLPLMLAGGTWVGGLSGALLTPAVLGGCALLSFAGLAGRLCGAWWGLAAELVLAVSLPEIYTSRTPFSEPLVQILLFGGLCLFIDSLVVRDWFPDRGGLALAGLGGLALGLTVLASIGSLGVLLPVFPALAVLSVARRPQATPFGLGLLAGIGIGTSAAFVLARSYLSTLSPQLHLIGLCVVGFGALTVVAAAMARAQSRVRRVFAFNVRFLWFKGERVALPSLRGLAQWVALVLPTFVLVGLAERPYFQVVRGQTDPAMIRAVAALQRLERLPVDGFRQYYESSLYWVLWYIGVPALLLACAGASTLGRRLVQAVLEGRSDPDSAPVSVVRLWGLPFVLIGWSVVAVLWDPAVVPWQPLASHRLVPVVLPGLVLLAVWVSWWLSARASALGASQPVVIAVGICCVLALAIPALVTTLNPSLAAQSSVGPESSGLSKLVSRVRLNGVGASATYGGSVAAASALCADIGSSASVLFMDSSTAGAFAPTVRGLCGQPAAVVVSAPSVSSDASFAAQIEQTVNSIRRVGRRPVLVGPTRASVSLSGVVPRQAVALRTSGDAETLTGAPAGTWPATYSVWVAVVGGQALSGRFRADEKPPPAFDGQS